MPRALLLTTTALACFAVTLGCQRERKAPNPPLQSVERTTTIWASPPSQPAADPARSAPPTSAEPEPAMSTPPVENVIDTPGLTPQPMPAPATPSRPPSPYRDGCGRPLVA